MPRELITVQVGQCGNQIGTRFWELALREHALNNKNGIFDDAMSSFFRNVDSRHEDPLEIPVGDGKQKIRSLKARAVLVDMEEGVVNNIIRDKGFSELFDERQFLTDTSGAGNNWAHGHEEYGPKYHDQLIELIRRPVEQCDSLQSFLLLHSLGGGTGSGVGTYILELLADEFPEAYRFTSCVVPSEDDDVITSPYNSTLALSKLYQHADCVLPVDNQSLIDISNKLSEKKKEEKEEDNAVKTKKSKPFDSMNTIAAQLLLNMTSSMRFGGSLNVDLNEITTNLVPYPKMHFLISSLTPIYSLGESRIQPRNMDLMFSDAFSKDFQLIRTDPKRNMYLACALMVRGADVEISDIRRNIEKIKPNLQFVNWNQEGWKIGHCLAPPLYQKHSLLCMANNSGIKVIFQEVQDRFMKLYRKKVYAHHYMDFGISDEYFKEALEDIKTINDAYSTIQSEANSGSRPVTAAQRLQPIL